MDSLSPLAVVLVEGESDRHALEALARRRGRDLDAERRRIVAIGGAKNIGSYLERFGPRGVDVRLAGLCDAGEERKTSGSRSSGRASARHSPGPEWSSSASTSATPTSRTS